MSLQNEITAPSFNSFHLGWTVFQRRVDGKTDFWRTWEDYKQGFGNLETNFWLGNDNLHLLTHITGRRQLLLIELVDKEGNTPCAQYSKFLIASEADKYRLTVGGYSGKRRMP